MDREIKAWLFDIMNSIEEIEQFLPQGQQLFEAYRKDLKTKRAVERNLEIIGEATNRVLAREPDFELAHSRKIISLRNRIIHGYDVISDELIWGIIVIDLPKLKLEISKYI
jgi:uncharacterized protein with HEPN domain